MREEWQERKLNDGTRHKVYKRWFDGPGLAAELGGGEVLHDGRWFVGRRDSARGLELFVDMPAMLDDPLRSDAEPSEATDPSSFAHSRGR